MDRGIEKRRAYACALVSAVLFGALVSPAEARTQRHRGEAQEDQAVSPVTNMDRQVLNGDRSIPPSRFDRPRNAPASAEDRNICVQEAVKAELRYGIPHGLYLAVLLKESQFSYGGKTFPHPWTINYKGQDYYYATKEAMISGLREMREAGIDNADSGCAQRNLYWHPVAHGTSLEDIVDPIKNIDWGARYFVTLLRGGVEEWGNTGNGRLVHNERVSGAGSWPEAVARYHAWMAEHGRGYAQSVYPIWERTSRQNLKERQAAIKEMGLDKPQRERKGRTDVMVASNLTPADFAGGFGGGARTQVADASPSNPPQRTQQATADTDAPRRQPARPDGRAGRSGASHEEIPPATGVGPSPYLVVEAGRHGTTSTVTTESAKHTATSENGVGAMFYRPVLHNFADGQAMVAAID